jgi:hypothetical protein
MHVQPVFHVPEGHHPGDVEHPQVPQSRRQPLNQAAAQKGETKPETEKTRNDKNGRKNNYLYSAITVLTHSLPIMIQMATKEGQSKEITAAKALRW